MILPKYRTELYAEWKACERFGLKPTGVKEQWEENNVMTQAALLAYNQIRDYEDAEAAVSGLM